MQHSKKSGRHRSKGTDHNGTDLERLVIKTKKRMVEKIYKEKLAPVEKQASIINSGDRVFYPVVGSVPWI